MKKFIPFILSIVIGSVFGLILFNNSDIDIEGVFSQSQKATAFQLGVFNTSEAASSLKNKYECAITMKDDDVFRVYYSILTNDKVINKMSDYLNNQKIAFYKKEIIITDEGLINAITTYQASMIEGSDTVLTSLNKLIMNSYEGVQYEN